MGLSGYIDFDPSYIGLSISLSIDFDSGYAGIDIDFLWFSLGLGYGWDSEVEDVQQ
jgi:hypothetical protein